MLCLLAKTQWNGGPMPLCPHLHSLAILFPEMITLAPGYVGDVFNSVLIGHLTAQGSRPAKQLRLQTGGRALC